MTLPERFWAKVQQGPGCWLWTGAPMSQGYGLFQHEGKRCYAHRLSYQHFYGDIPPGKEMDHLCRTKLCVNPFHLEAVTSRENTLRGFGKTAFQARQTHCIHGHEFNPRNTGRRRNGGRYCKTCVATRDRIRWRRKRDQARRERGAAPPTPPPGALGGSQQPSRCLGVASFSPRACSQGCGPEGMDAHRGAEGRR